MSDFLLSTWDEHSIVVRKSFCMLSLVRFWTCIRSDGLFVCCHWSDSGHAFAVKTFWYVGIGLICQMSAKKDVSSFASWKLYFNHYLHTNVDIIHIFSVFQAGPNPTKIWFLCLFHKCMYLFSVDGRYSKNWANC